MNTSPQYSTLVSQRKQCRACPRLMNPAAIDGGIFDSDHIGPYSRWQGNLDARLVVVAQDFADVDTFRRVQGWPGERVQTNLTLVKLLEAAGIDVLPPRMGVSDDRVFFTNAVLCLKAGNMQAAVPKKYFHTCGERFLRPIIELVAPAAVATLGVGALDAVLYAFGKRRSVGFRELMQQGEVFDLMETCRLFPMYHPSRTVLNTTRPLAQQTEDWKRLGVWLQTRD